MIPSYTEIINPTAEIEMFCEYVFERGVCCGGHDTQNLLPNTNMCGFYDCDEDKWVNMHDFPLALYYEASTVVKRYGEDYGLMVSGGYRKCHELTEKVDNFPAFFSDRYGISIQQRKEVYLLNKHFRWDELNTEMPNERSGHCMVQINDCEVAFIGGSSESISTTTTIGALDTVDIYNFVENTWRAGPTYVCFFNRPHFEFPALLSKAFTEFQLKLLMHFLRLAEAVQLPACGLVRDRIYFDDKVVIGCGSNTANVQIWSLDSDEVYMSAFTCPNVDSLLTYHAKFKKADDTTLLLTNNIDGVIYAFTAEYGFEPVVQTLNYQQGDSFVATSGYATCL